MICVSVDCMTVMNVLEEAFDKQDGVVSNTVVKTQSVCLLQTKRYSTQIY